MTYVYSISAIDARLQGVADTIDGGGSNGNLKLLVGGTLISTVQLSVPCGTVNGGLLTFTGSLIDPSVAATGSVDNAIIEDSNGSTVVSGLTVGIPLSGADIIIGNGLNTTLLSSGKVLQLFSAQIVGS